jgi:hypothetical protein
MVLLRTRQHSPECGDRVTAQAQTCLPSIALATEGLRTPWTAFAVVNDNKIPPEGGTPNAFIAKLTRYYKDKALGVPALAGILRATKSKIPAAECVGNGGDP